MDSDQCLTEILTAAKRMLESLCRTESRVPMPAIAQRMNGHETYSCGLVRGHDGPHRWPVDGSIAEWVDEDA